MENHQIITIFLGEWTNCLSSKIGIALDFVAQTFSYQEGRFLHNGIIILSKNNQRFLTMIN